MNNFDPKEFEIKLAIAEQAVDLYIVREGAFTLKTIADKLELSVSEIFNYFPNKRAILQFYYASMVVRYRLMIDEIEDFDTYTLGEKLSNFTFVSFDMLEEKKPFVDATFKKLILYSYEKTDYEKEVEKLLQEFFERDELVTATSAAFLNQYVYACLRRQYLALVRFWLDDTSEDHGLSMELTDKLTTFIQELMYSAVLDKSIDLFKFLAANNRAFLEKIPFAKNIFSKVEIR